MEVEAVEMDSAESVDLSAEEYDEVQVDEWPCEILLRILLEIKKLICYVYF